MSIEVNRMLKLFAGLQHGDCWVGTNFKEALQNLDAIKAAAALSEEGNSIWQLTTHLIYWRSTVVNRLNGSDNLPPFRDFFIPDILSETNWKRTLLDFETTYHLLRNAIQYLKDEQLDKPSLKPGQSFYQLIMGCLQHDAYHLGQIVLLKKNG